MFLFTLQANVRYALSGENSKNKLIDKSEMFFILSIKEIAWRLPGKCYLIHWLTSMLIFFFLGGGLNLKRNAFLNKLHKHLKSQVVLNTNNVNNTKGIFPKPQRKD